MNLKTVKIKWAVMLVMSVVWLGIRIGVESQ